MTTFTVDSGHGRVLLETDDWLEAERACMAAVHRAPDRFKLPFIQGVHPTHIWARVHPSSGAPVHDATCTECGAWANGSYGSHAPCGFDFQGRSLHYWMTTEEA